MNRAVFLDRDGVVIEERHYLHRSEDVALIPGAGAALSRLRHAGFGLFLITNQSGVGRGFFTLAEVERVHEHLARLLALEGARLDRIYVAPEAPGQPSRGRKPSPQFLEDARAEFGIDLGGSYMIGDKLVDLECGWNAGVRRVLLVQTGYGGQTAREAGPALADAVVVPDLPAAADWILAQTAAGV